MRLHGGGVDEHLRRRATRTRKRMEEIDPHTLCRPTDVAVVEGLMGSVDARRIDRARAGLQNENDPAARSNNFMCPDPKRGATETCL